MNNPDSLFQPLTIDDQLTLANRIVMAPLTRCMADDDLVPTDTMAAYYARRADAGLIISEATIIRPDGQGYPNTPGLYSQAQIDGWRKVTDAVHERGGRMFAQLWHTGRASHAIYHDGKAPVAPSAIALKGRVARTELDYGIPRALETAEVEQVVRDYATAAGNALEAGFDGVEIHGANGYLIDQFLHGSSNQREDEYGGSVQKRTRFAEEVVAAVVAVAGETRVGLRLSPAAYFNMTAHEEDPQVFIHLLSSLKQFDLAYIHTGMFDDSQQFPAFEGNVTAFLRRHYPGRLIGAGGYTVESGSEAIAAGQMDLVAFGRPFIANPNLVSAIKNQEQLTDYHESMLPTLV